MNQINYDSIIEDVYLGEDEEYIQLQTLAETYKPISFFHSKEPYFPATLSDYLKNCQLLQNETTLINPIENPNDIVTFNDELKQITTTNYNYSVKLLGPVARRKGAEWYFKDNEMNKEWYPETPVYYTFILTGQYMGQNVVDIVYLYSYPYNGTFAPHQYDEEICAIRFVNNEPSSVGLSAHGGITWHPWSSLEKTGKQIHVFIAKESHAVYPAPKNYHRIFGFGTDYCDRGYQATFPLVFLPSQYTEMPLKYLYFNFIGQRATGTNIHFTPKSFAYLNTLSYPSIHTSNQLIIAALNQNVWILHLLGGLLLMAIGGIVATSVLSNDEWWFIILQILAIGTFFVICTLLITIYYNAN